MKWEYITEWVSPMHGPYSSLKRMGENGWELVAVYDNTTLIFKRPISPAAQESK